MDREKLTARQDELIRIVEAIDSVLHSKEWQTLRGEFDGFIDLKERQLLTEAKNQKIEVDKIYFLQGELAALKRYDLAIYAEKCKKELEGIKLNLQ